MSLSATHIASYEAPTADRSPAPPITVRAEINLRHLRHNVRALQERAGCARLMGVVKANAYGHGVRRVAEVLRQEGVRHLAVANLPEAIELREAGAEEPILVFAAPLPEYLPVYVRHDLGVTVSSPEVADAVMGTAQREGPLRVHVKVETGMGRIGVPPEQVSGIVTRLRRAPRVTIAGLWTHLASADEEDLSFTEEQLARFQKVLAQEGDAAEHVHVANSAALLALPEEATALPSPLVRVGLSLYGLAPRAGMVGSETLRPAMRFTSRVTHLKTVAPGTPVSYGGTWHADRRVRIATVGAGYADGYPRLVSNRAAVGIRGRRYPVVGNVCMDMFMVNLGALGGAGARIEVGDEVVLFGDGGPSAHDVARWAETIPYEVCTSVGPRVPRTYEDRKNGCR